MPPKKITGGVWPAVLSPVEQDGTLNEKSLEQMINLFVEQKLAGLYLLGSTGQGPSLECALRRRIMELAAKYNADRIPLMVHVGAVSTEDAIDLAKHAADHGAHAIISVPPIYYPVNADMMFEHYRRIADATSLPFFPYHAGFLNMALPPAPVYAQKMKDLPNFAGIKLTEANFFFFTILRRHLGPDYVLFSGFDENMCCGLISGADGAIGSFMNIFGPAFIKVHEAFIAGEFDMPRRFTDEFASLIELMLNDRTKFYPFIRAAMKVKYNIHIGLGRSIFHQGIGEFSEAQALELVNRVNASAGV